MKKLHGLPPSDSAVRTVVTEQPKDDVPCAKEPKMIKLENDDEETSKSGFVTGDATWVTYKNYSLSFDDLAILSSRRNLSDKHINLAQELVKKHHSNIVGLKSTLFLQTRCYCYTEVERQSHLIQIIHLNHGNSGLWIVASNIRGGELAEVTIYDSLNNTANNYTRNLLKHLLTNTNITIFVL